MGTASFWRYHSQIPTPTATAAAEIQIIFAFTLIAS